MSIFKAALSFITGGEYGRSSLYSSRPRPRDFLSDGERAVFGLPTQREEFEDRQREGRQQLAGRVSRDDLSAYAREDRIEAARRFMSEGDFYNMYPNERYRYDDD